MFHKNVSPSQLYKTTLIRTVSDATEIAFINKKGPKWALLFLLRTNKEACKITKVPLLSVCKTKKAILPFNHRHKMHVLHPKQSELAMGSKRFWITWIFPGYKILLWMQLQKYFDPNAVCLCALSSYYFLEREVKCTVSRNQLSFLYKIVSKIKTTLQNRLRK